MQNLFTFYQFVEIQLKKGDASGDIFCSPLIYKVGLELSEGQNRRKTTRIWTPRLNKAKPSETKL